MPAVKGIAGRKVAAVYRALFEDADGQPHVCVAALEFADGSVARFTVVEGEGEYGVQLVYPARAIDDADHAAHAAAGSRRKAAAR